MRQTKIGYFADFVVYPVAIALLVAYRGLKAPAGGIVIFLALFLLGLAAWTLLEYLLHRFVFHHVVFIRDMHDAHHNAPVAYVGSPTALSVACFAVLALAPLWFAFGAGVATAATAGLMLGYLGYLVVHHGVHHWRVAPGSALYLLKHRHARHHYAKVEGNFGVTTIFWDRVFGTAI
jgi:sterol desaturase/sphingolipid hydroxylase (fatty acid hydroxylase superfamily)